MPTDFFKYRMKNLRSSSSWIALALGLSLIVSTPAHAQLKELPINDGDVYTTSEVRGYKLEQSEAPVSVSIEDSTGIELGTLNDYNFDSLQNQSDYQLTIDVETHNNITTTFNGRILANSLTEAGIFELNLGVGDHDSVSYNFNEAILEERNGVLYINTKGDEGDIISININTDNITYNASDPYNNTGSEPINASFIDDDGSDLMNISVSGSNNAAFTDKISANKLEISIALADFSSTSDVNVKELKINSSSSMVSDGKINVTETLDIDGSLTVNNQLTIADYDVSIAGGDIKFGASTLVLGDGITGGENTVFKVNNFTSTGGSESISVILPEELYNGEIIIESDGNDDTAAFKTNDSTGNYNYEFEDRDGATVLIFETTLRENIINDGDVYDSSNIRGYQTQESNSGPSTVTVTDSTGIILGSVEKHFFDAFQNFASQELTVNVETHNGITTVFDGGVVSSGKTEDSIFTLNLGVGDHDVVTYYFNDSIYSNNAGPLIITANGDEGDTVNVKINTDALYQTESYTETYNGSFTDVTGSDVMYLEIEGARNPNIASDIDVSKLEISVESVNFTSESDVNVKELQINSGSTMIMDGVINVSDTLNIAGKLTLNSDITLDKYNQLSGEGELEVGSVAFTIGSDLIDGSDTVLKVNSFTTTGGDESIEVIVEEDLWGGEIILENDGDDDTAAFKSNESTGNYEYIFEDNNGATVLKFSSLSREVRIKDGDIYTESDTRGYKAAEDTADLTATIKDSTGISLGTVDDFDKDSLQNQSDHKLTVNVETAAGLTTTFNGRILANSSTEAGIFDLNLGLGDHDAVTYVFNESILEQQNGSLFINVNGDEGDTITLDIKTNNVPDSINYSGDFIDGEGSDIMNIILSGSSNPIFSAETTANALEIFVDTVTYSATSDINVKNLKVNSGSELISNGNFNVSGNLDISGKLTINNQLELSGYQSTQSTGTIEFNTADLILGSDITGGSDTVLKINNFATTGGNESISVIIKEGLQDGDIIIESDGDDDIAAFKTEDPTGNYDYVFEDDNGATILKFNSLSQEAKIKDGDIYTETNTRGYKAIDDVTNLTVTIKDSTGITVGTAGDVNKDSVQNQSDYKLTVNVETQDNITTTFDGRIFANSDLEGGRLELNLGVGDYDNTAYIFNDAVMSKNQGSVFVNVAGDEQDTVTLNINTDNILETDHYNGDFIDGIGSDVMNIQLSGSVNPTFTGKTVANKLEISVASVNYSENSDISVKELKINAGSTMVADGKLNVQSNLDIDGKLTVNNQLTISDYETSTEGGALEVGTATLVMGSNITGGENTVFKVDEFTTTGGENSITVTLPEDLLTGEIIIESDNDNDANAFKATDDNQEYNYVFEDRDGATVLKYTKISDFAGEEAVVYEQVAASLLAVGSEAERAAFQAALNAGGQTAENAISTAGTQTETQGGAAAASQENRQAVQDILSNQISARRVGITSAQGGFSGGDEPLQGPLNTAWLRAYGGLGQQSKTSEDDGFEVSHAGVVVGYDRKIDEAVVLGLFGSYATSTVEGDGAGRPQVNTTGYQAGVYAGIEGEHYYLDGMLAYTFGQSQTQRFATATKAIAMADFNSSTFSTSLHGGVPLTIASNIFLTPNAGLALSYYLPDGYTERGAGALNQQVEQEASLQAVGSIGMQLSSVHQYSGIELTPELNFGLSYDFANQDAVAVSRFLGGGTAYETVGTAIDPLSLELGLGLGIKWNEEVSLTLNYDADLRDNYISHAGRAQLEWRF